MDTNKKALINEYKQRPLTGGVCIIRNQENGRYKLEAQTNLQGSQSRFTFNQMTDCAPSPSMNLDWSTYGKDAFSFEILEEVTQKETQLPEEFRSDIKILGELWAEKFDPAKAYK